MNSSKYKIIRVNSDDRISGTNTNFAVQFNDIDAQRVLRYNLKSVSFPNLFNNIDGRNGTNVFTFFSTLGGVNFSVTVPVGQYTATELATTLSSLMTAAMAGLAGPPTVVVSLNSDNKFLFTVTGDTITLLSDNSINAMAGITGIVSDVGPSVTPTATEQPNLFGEQMVFVHSRQLNNSHAILSAGLSVSSFAEVPITVEYGALQYYANFENDSGVIYTTGTNNANLTIKLRSADGTILSLPENQKILINLKVWY